MLLSCLRQPQHQPTPLGQPTNHILAGLIASVWAQHGSKAPKGHGKRRDLREPGIRAALICCPLSMALVCGSDLRSFSVPLHFPWFFLVLLLLVTFPGPLFSMALPGPPLSVALWAPHFLWTLIVLLPWLGTY